MDLLETSSAWIESQREKFLSRPVIYVRGGASVELAATIGRTVFRLEDGAGAVIHVESRDYLFRTAHLVLDGQKVLPQRGDQVHELWGEVIHVYEVTAPSDEPHWRYSDPYRMTLRVHTQQLETV